MVTVCLEPVFPFMDRCGMATGTRKVARKLWNNRLPDGDRQTLVRELYAAENEGFSEPSGSQDMIGLIYPGCVAWITTRRLKGGTFRAILNAIPILILPAGSSGSFMFCRWRRGRKGIIRWRKEPGPPVGPAPRAERQGLLRRDRAAGDWAAGAAMNRCMECWAALLPNTVRHRTLTVDLPGLLKHTSPGMPGRCTPDAAADTCTLFQRNRSSARWACGCEHHEDGGRVRQFR